MSLSRRCLSLRVSPFAFMMGRLLLALFLLVGRADGFNVPARNYNSGHEACRSMLLGNTVNVREEAELAVALQEPLVSCILIAVRNLTLSHDFWGPEGAYFRGRNCTRYSWPFCEFQVLTRPVVIAPLEDQYANIILPSAGFYHFSAVQAVGPTGELIFVNIRFMGNLFPPSTRLGASGLLTPDYLNIESVLRSRNVFGGPFRLVNCLVLFSCGNGEKKGKRKKKGHGGGGGGGGGGDDVLASLSTHLPFESTYDPSENALYVGLGELDFQFPLFTLPEETFVIKTNETKYRLDPFTRLESYRIVDTIFGCCDPDFCDALDPPAPCSDVQRTADAYVPDSEHTVQEVRARGRRNLTYKVFGAELTWAGAYAACGSAHNGTLATFGSVAALEGALRELLSSADFRGAHALSGTALWVGFDAAHGDPSGAWPGQEGAASAAREIPPSGLFWDLQPPLRLPRNCTLVLAETLLLTAADCLEERPYVCMRVDVVPPDPAGEGAADGDGSPAPSAPADEGAADGDGSPPPPDSNLANSRLTLPEASDGDGGSSLPIVLGSAGGVLVVAAALVAVYFSKRSHEGAFLSALFRGKARGTSASDRTIVDDRGARAMEAGSSSMSASIQSGLGVALSSATADPLHVPCSSKRDSEVLLSHYQQHMKRIGSSAVLFAGNTEAKPMKVKMSRKSRAGTATDTTKEGSKEEGPSSTSFTASFSWEEFRTYRMREHPTLPEYRVQDGPNNIWIDGYKVLQVVGSGTHAVCFLVEEAETGNAFMAKVPTSPVQNLVQEAYILSQLDHPNIVMLKETILQDSQLVLVMEYADCGDLEKLCRTLHHYPGEFKERLGIHVLYHMALALSFLHKNLIAHRDIKPANIVITSHSIFKLVDFGVSRTIINSANTFAGTPLNMAPEILMGQPYGQESDIWSLGSVIFRICTGQYIRPPQDDVKTMMEIESGKQDGFAALIGESSFQNTKLQAILTRVLDPDPAARPSASDLCALSWLTDFCIKDYVSFSRALRHLVREEV